MSNRKLVRQYSYDHDGDGHMALTKSTTGGLVRVRDVRRLLDKVAAHIKSEPGAGAALQEELERWRRAMRYKT